MRLTVDNGSVLIEGANPRLIKAVDRATSFYVTGHEFHPAFRSRWWDGKEHLVKKVKKRPAYKVPVGMLDRVIDVANDVGEHVELIDARPELNDPVDVEWISDKAPRDYQQGAADAVCMDRGLATGKGMLRVPTRGGKTLISALIIARLKLRTLFLVPSQMLLAQTVAALSEMLSAPIGIIGDGRWEPTDITVVSIQTLAKRLGARDPGALDLVASVDVVFFDECHHLKGNVWRDAFQQINARYKIGLSATIFLKDEDDNEVASIWLVATTGPVLYSIEPDELIRRGYLVRPRVTCVKIREPKVSGVSWQKAYRMGVVEHGARNQLIVDLAFKRCSAGKAVLVVTSSLEHTAILASALERVGLVVGTIIGSTPAEARADIVAGFVASEVDVLLGTVFGEGVDIPKIEVVINAEGGKSQTTTTQKFRNITPSPGKETAEMIDFMDLHNKYLAGHSLSRLQLYRGHEEFQFKVVEAHEVD